MANIPTTGGGEIFADGRRIIRRVFVSTDGSASDPSPPAGYRLTNKSSTDEPGGVKRTIFEYTSAQNAGGGSDPNFNAYGKRFELLGGTREVPLKTHDRFKDLSNAAIADVEKAVENKESKTFNNPTQRLLFDLLSKGVEYILAPSVVGRITEVQSGLPSLGPLAKRDTPVGLPSSEGTMWVCTGISATPIGDRFQVTREYTLNFANPSLVDIYNW